MKYPKTEVTKRIVINYPLLASLFLSILVIILCFHGIKWGNYQSWNPDDMAFNKLFNNQSMPFNPGWFVKPPFHIYFIFFTVVLPLQVINTYTHFTASQYAEIQYLLAKLINIAFFVLTILLGRSVIKNAQGNKIAIIATAILGTSAGIIPFTHFLTVDIPVMTWMILAFYFGQKIYITKAYTHIFIAGFFCGIAIATKYNGIFVLPGLCMFLWMSDKKNIKKWILLLSSTCIGFFMGNPYSLLDYRTFLQHFYYLVRTDSLYASFNPTVGALVDHIIEIIGIPALMYLLLIIGTLLWNHTSMRKQQKIATATSFASGAIFLSAMFFIAQNPFFTRYYLPVIPFLIVFLFSLVQEKVLFTKPFIIILCCVISYNLFNAYIVGTRFNNDPRREAQTIINALPSSTLEITGSAVTPSVEPDKQNLFKITTIPFITGRNKKFKKTFINDRIIYPLIDQFEFPDNISFFTKEKFLERNPDFVIVNSNLYDFMYWGSNFRYEYPSVMAYYDSIVYGLPEYHVLFDKKAEQVSPFLYPKSIDFLGDRILILKKNSILHNEQL